MYMPLIPDRDLGAARALSELTYCNPFLPERIDLERRVLGDAFEPVDIVWHPGGTVAKDSPNVPRTAERAERLVAGLQGRMRSGKRASEVERDLYRDLCLYVLYNRHEPRLLALFEPKWVRRADFYDAFVDDLERLFLLPGIGLPPGYSAAHVFACFFQIRRAFHHTFLSIAGSSLPAARLRAEVWQSILTHDLRRYMRTLYRRMGDVTTLITGPSGAGKELVGRSIGLSRFIPFDPAARTFAESAEASFFPLNLSALSPTLIESELFGHRRGAFTGAVSGRKGWLEVCPSHGTVFLDEIGDIESSIQVKLLRVLETRTFQPLGTSDDRRFQGKIIAATNRDLADAMRAGRFRDDLYYRLCADTVVAPSLRERLADSPAELPIPLTFLATRLVGPDEAFLLAAEAEQWIEENLGADYAWPGNVRELSHCVSNVMIHRNYSPPAAPRPAAARERLAADFAAGELPAEEMLRRYCTLVYAETGSYLRAAERLGLDRRTVKSRVDVALLDELRSG
jgi:DNA-binding NtrC family response regulator